MLQYMLQKFPRFLNNESAVKIYINYYINIFVYIYACFQRVDQIRKRVRYRLSKYSRRSSFRTKG